jgi:carbamoyltransferase
MNYWGINALNHGNSLSVIRGHELLFHRFDRSDELDEPTFRSALVHGMPDRIYWYERPWLKKLRQFKAGQYPAALDLSVIPRMYLNSHGLNRIGISYTPHHASHAAAGYYTSTFDRCAVVVIDAIGEFECATVWEGHNGRLIKRWSRSYPNSLGLFYSAFTKLIGYEPIIEEYRLQEDSYLGDPHRYHREVSVYFNGTLRLAENLHRGVRSWPHAITCTQDRYDIAAAVQRVFEDQVDIVMMIAKNLTGSDSLVYMGGCAMNGRYNQRLYDRWNRVWSLPNPGDPSSSLGAVLYHTKQRISAEKLGVVKHLDIRV